ncbi:GFA family protein [Phenylobacterium montanum]|uniref:GFA family protein n=1 Tax=Phenylobacterium montanum TaxID=2823693 RepID=UPI0020117B56|nr:GFA family protein [Caulobacter sp. S6]
MPITGQCRCGQVRFEVSAKPLLTMACHCRGCQQMTASAFSLSAAIPTEGFRVTSGEPVIGGLHGPARHYFCGYCMSWMFTRPDGMDFFVNVRSTLLDERVWDAPFIEVYTDEKLPWASTPARHSYPTFPPQEAYGALIAEFAAQAG